MTSWAALSRRVDYVIFNRSLHTPTNGELWLLTQLPLQPVVIDVGYNEGEFTAEILTHRPTAQVIAFDPSRQASAAYARRHGSAATVRFEPIALSSVSQDMQFHDYGNMCSSLAERQDQAAAAATVYTVKVERLDNVMQRLGIEHIHFLKIDAEGFDLHVMEGAAHLLDRQAVDCVMFEYADGWISSRRFLQEADEYISGKPYRLFRLFNGFLHSFSYSHDAERFDLGCMYVAVSRNYLATGRLPIKEGFFRN